MLYRLYSGTDDIISYNTCSMIIMILYFLGAIKEDIKVNCPGCITSVPGMGHYGLGSTFNSLSEQLKTRAHEIKRNKVPQKEQLQYKVGLLRMAVTSSLEKGKIMKMAKVISSFFSAFFFGMVLM